MMNKKAIYHRTDDFTLLQGDCIRLMGEFDFKFDMIFADPPYFLSNGGISVQSGKVVCVDKGEWDKAVRRNISTNSTRSGFRLAGNI